MNIDDFDKIYLLSSHLDLNTYLGKQSWSSDRIIKRIQELAKVAFYSYGDTSATFKLKSRQYLKKE
jgi:hypothetical protein